ncbi:SIR2 family protein [Lysinibacillus capsici]|uniref:SIR2 family protein n=1 Tax=Lysinibacillus capsici TaxID=2115968 RepID=UPI0029DE9088|nr:SIR2 family protein [Lysinibacillus capsici]WPK04934.1 SIR2 family protein [Lysinibacillus capsici]
MDIEEALSLHLSKFTTAPFLFIGSGFSKRYLDTENWEGLINKFCELVPQGFSYYRSTSNGKWDVAAQMIAEDFHQIWWNDERYLESRNEFQEYATNKYSALKIEISKYLKNKEYEYGVNEQNDTELNCLKEAVIDGIITTNWDTLLEQIFSKDDMTTYIGQKKLLFSNNLGVNEIYKIHGCSTEPDSLVLTHDDYEEFTSRNAYLASKLLTIFVEHPVIFIGYSISDANIIQILESITACLDSSNIGNLKDRLIFVERARGANDFFQESTMTINGLTIPITKVVTDHFDKVYRPLTTIKRKFSTKKLRQMKNEMYELVKHNDPKGKIKVINFMEGEENNDKVEFVVGFGMDHFAEQIEGIIESSDKLKPSKIRHSSLGYTTYSRKDLLEEIIADNDTYSYDYDELLKSTLPEKLKTDQRLPVNRFIRFSSIKDMNDLDYKIIKKKNLKLNDFLTKQQQREKSALSFDWQFNSVREVYDGYNNLEEKFFYIAILNESKIDLTELREILLENLHLVDSTDLIGTNLRRLFRIYDYLAFGRLIIIRSRKYTLKKYCPQKFKGIFSEKHLSIRG